MGSNIIAFNIYFVVYVFIISMVLSFFLTLDFNCATLYRSVFVFLFWLLISALDSGEISVCL